MKLLQKIRLFEGKFGKLLNSTNFFGKILSFKLLKSRLLFKKITNFTVE